MQIKIDVTPLMGGRTFKEFVIKCLRVLILQLLFFYYIYIDALSIGGSSLIAYGGFVGIILYSYNRFPFKEVSRIGFFFILILICIWISEQLNQRFDGYMMTLTRTQLGFFFTSYLIIFIYFNVHKNHCVEHIAAYIGFAVVLQCIATVLMSKIPEVNEFLSQYTNHETGVEERREFYEKMRLVGYGSSLFGGGMIAGVGLIMQAYLIAVVPFNRWQLILVVLAYFFTFFVGLFTARTTVVGFAFSAILIIVISIKNSSVRRNQVKGFFIIGLFSFIVGVSLCLKYFPEYADWAFEMWYTYKATGRFTTQSSETLRGLLSIPLGSYQDFLWGKGIAIFWGNDMGYTRFLYLFGFVGTFFFILYMFVIVYSSMTKDKNANMLIIIIFLYALALNVKGLTDLNFILYLFFFFFMFYKYYVYYPNLYLSKLINKRKIDNIQTI